LTYLIINRPGTFEIQGTAETFRSMADLVEFYTAAVRETLHLQLRLPVYDSYVKDALVPLSDDAPDSTPRAAPSMAARSCAPRTDYDVGAAHTTDGLDLDEVEYAEASATPEPAVEYMLADGATTYTALEVAHEGTTADIMQPNNAAASTKRRPPSDTYARLDQCSDDHDVQTAATARRKPANADDGGCNNYGLNRYSEAIYGLANHSDEDEGAEDESGGGTYSNAAGAESIAGAEGNYGLAGQVQGERHHGTPRVEEGVYGLAGIRVDPTLRRATDGGDNSDSESEPADGDVYQMATCAENAVTVLRFDGDGDGDGTDPTYSNHLFQGATTGETNDDCDALAAAGDARLVEVLYGRHSHLFASLKDEAEDVAVPNALDEWQSAPGFVVRRTTVKRRGLDHVARLLGVAVSELQPR
jgi:hypothetical protein